MPSLYTGSQTDAEIIKAAGVVCGKFDVDTNSTSNRFAQSLEVCYGDLIDAELGSNRWRFAQHNQAISTLTALDPAFDSWTYYWDFPADLLMLLGLDPMVHYTIWGKRLLTSTNQPITVKYTRNVPVNEWNAAFKKYMIYALAEEVALSVTEPSKVSQITALKEKWQSRALFADGQAVPQQPFYYNPWVDIRRWGL